MDTIHHPDGDLWIYWVSKENTTKVVEDKATLGSEVENHSGKVSMLTYTVSWVLEAKVNQVNPCFSMM